MYNTTPAHHNTTTTTVLSEYRRLKPMNREEIFLFELSSLYLAVDSDADTVAFLAPVIKREGRVSFFDRAEYGELILTGLSKWGRQVEIVQGPFADHYGATEHHIEPVVYQQESLVIA